MTKIYASPRDLIGQEGTVLGPTEWLAIEQDRVNGFAEVTGDHQWIHVDVERAKEGPFGGTIAHGYLTMSLVNYFLPDLIEVRGFTHAVNVGADRLRFLAPVKVGSRIRGVGEIVGVEEVKGAIQSVVRVTVEIEGSEKPACVVDTISRYFPE
ncbi:MaoC family dehydratase [Novosphingobium arvoryzae]|uniref:MaoC family dehydratase n=1 Tax=Novosphingobium arvoryzae TaxID=1256514 RepID=A0A918RI33_9SPHN|nr:MaoC family dehydratase [Novosphingobium arvoryzae]GGZ97149.1 MaoC family dehydratase [Novosphingobium arvoryzae]